MTPAYGRVPPTFRIDPNLSMRKHPHRHIQRYHQVNNKDWLSHVITPSSIRYSNKVYRLIALEPDYIITWIYNKLYLQIYLNMCNDSYIAMKPHNDVVFKTCPSLSLTCYINDYIITLLFLLRAWLKWPVNIAYPVLFFWLSVWSLLFSFIF